MTISAARLMLKTAGLTCWLLSLASILPPVQAVEPMELAVRVRDGWGQSLEGVEIRIVAPHEPASMVAAGRSDARGRFMSAKLPPGPYRIALAKPGYLNLVAQVNTWLSKTVDVILKPTPQNNPDALSLPEDAAWPLRLTRRSLWHQIEPTEPSSSSTWRASTGEEPQLAKPLHLQFDQLFSMQARPDGYEAEETRLAAAESRIAVTSSLGGRGQLTLEGRRENLESSSATADQTSAGRQSGNFQSELAYRASADDQLDLHAYYGYEQYDLSAGFDPLSRQGLHAWSLDGSWARQLQEQSQLALSLGYRGATLQSPLEHPAAFSVETALAKKLSTAEQAGAGSGGQSHELQLALRAQHLGGATPKLTSVAGPLPLELAPGWNLQLDAQDSWSISEPWSLIYGLGLKQFLAAPDTALVVPRLGWAWADDDWRLRASISYSAVTSWADSFKPLGAPDHPLGYEAELRAPIGSGVNLEAFARYVPVQLDALNFGSGYDALDPHPWYVMGSDASLQENRLRLASDRPFLRAYLELERGRAQGALATLLPFDGPYALQLGRELRYRNARLGWSFGASATDLQLEYRRLDARSLAPYAGSSDAVEQAFALRLAQQLWGIQTRVDWRFLAALQLDSFETASIEQWSSASGEPAPLDTLSRRMSAGLSVAF